MSNCEVLGRQLLGHSLPQAWVGSGETPAGVLRRGARFYNHSLGWDDGMGEGGWGRVGQRDHPS